MELKVDIEFIVCFKLYQSAFTFVLVLYPDIDQICDLSERPCCLIGPGKMSKLPSEGLAGGATAPPPDPPSLGLRPTPVGLDP